MNRTDESSTGTITSNIASDFIVPKGSVFDRHVAARIDAIDPTTWTNRQFVVAIEDAPEIILKGTLDDDDVHRWRYIVRATGKRTGLWHHTVLEALGRISTVAELQ